MAQQKRENYFEVNIRDFGDNFINTKSAQDIQKDAKKRIFKDMVYNNINYELYGKFFTNPNFVDNLISIAAVESQKHKVTANALQDYYGKTLDPVAYSLCVQHQNCQFALENIKYSLEMVKNNNYDIQHLTQLQISLSTVPTCRRDYSEFY